MAGTETKRIIELTEASTVQSGDFIAVDSNARGTKKVPTDALATSAALTAETNARTGADEQMSERMDGIEEQTALIQNPTKTLSGALVSFTDGADMPMVACSAEIVPKQSGTGTPSPDNVRPISGRESVNVFDTGKNLWSDEFADYSQPQDYRVFPIDLKIGQTYTVSAVKAGSTVTGCVIGIVKSGDRYTNFVDPVPWLIVGSNGVIESPNATYTVDATWTDPKLIVYAEDESTFNSLFENYHIQLELGSTATAYEPYTGTTTTIPLGRTVYGGTLDVVSGVLTDKMGMATFDGSEAWALDATVSGITKFYITQSDMKKMSDYTSALTANIMTASRNGYITGDVSYMSVTGYSGAVGNYLYIMSKGAETGITTVAQLKGWLASHNLQVVYPLEQPQTYQLTPTEVNTLLGENNVWADSGDVEITYRRDISIVLENLENALSGSNSLNTMMMSAPTENTAEEPTEDEAEDDMR